MSTRPKRRTGFSLIELIIALMIGAIVLSALMVATTFASHRQMTILRDTTLVGQAVMSVETVRASLRSASYIVAPSTGAQADFMAGYINADQSANFAPILAGQPQTYFYYCTAPGPPRRFYRHTGPLGTPPNQIPAIICGQPGGESLAGDSQNRLVPTFRFSRAFDSGNMITVDYTLSYSAGASVVPQVIQGQTSIQTQAPLL